MRFDRDPGLLEALRAAGSVTKLAALLGLTQPSVSSWKRIPAGRVVEIERVTGVPRQKLRPDLYEAA